MQLILNYMQKFEWGYISLPNFPLSITLCYFLCVIFLLYFLKRPSKIHFLYFCMASIFTITVYLNTYNKSIYILNMDQASSILIKGEKNILVDSGKSKFNFCREYSIPLILKNLNINKIDDIYISHLDYDHYGQTNIILKDWQDCKIYLPVSSLYFKKKTIHFLRKIENLRKVHFISAGYSKTVDNNIHLLCLAPSIQEYPSSVNATSLVFKIFSSDQSILFGGDIDLKQITRLMIYDGILKSDILIFPHHGSTTGFYPPFMEKVSPGLTLFSCGWNNSFQHPAKEVIQYMKDKKFKFKRTDMNGCIAFEE